MFPDLVLPSDTITPGSYRYDMCHNVANWATPILAQCCSFWLVILISLETGRTVWPSGLRTVAWLP
jgi:hypothetical protein